MKKIQIPCLSQCSAMVLTSLGLLAVTPMQANAQEESAQIIEEVVVAASRVKSRPGYEAPTPTTVLDIGLIEEMGTVNVADALNRMPSLSASNSPRSNGNNTSTPNQGANFLNLRGLGTNRTLVMLDGRRVAAAAVTGEVDLNLLPTDLLKRTEIVTGGASAAWGSDAVAGVVNLVLDREYTGFKASIQAGTSAESDGDETLASFAGGFAFAEGRGHVLASLRYTDVEGIERADSRDWFNASKLVGNPAWTATNGEPFRIVVPNVGNIIGSDAGHTFASAGPLAWRSYDANGNALPFDVGTPYPRGPYSDNIIAGDGELNDFAGRTALTVGFESINTFGRVSYDLTDNVNVYGEYIYGNTEAETRTVPYYRFAGAVRIQRDNPFLPAALAADMDTGGVTSVPMGLSNVQFGRANPYNDRDFNRYVIGADIKINDNWEMETYFQTGTTDIHAEVRSNANRARYDLAVDAVDDGSGNIICRSTLTDPTNGCVAANIFGSNSASQAAIDYVIGAAIQDTEVTQTVFAISATGDLFDLPAGPVSSAFGYEYRKEEFSTTADDISEVDGWWTGNYKSADGEYDVNEVFGEVVIPVFADSALGESLDLNAAVRLTDYSTSGNVTTWKIGATYDIGAGLSLRGTQSRDIRAPNLNEYFGGGITNSVFFDDTATGDVARLVPRTITGNPNLDPEKADTTTFGIVYQPEFVEGLTVSIDYTSIDIDDAISSIEDQLVVTRCNQGVTEFCNLIVRNEEGRLANVFNGPVNFAFETLTAYDIEAIYTFDMAGGSVDIRSLWTYTEEHYTNDGDVTDDLLGEYAGGNGAFNGGPQEWRSLTSVSYSNDRFSVSLRNRFIGDGVLNADWESGVDVDDNTIPSVSYFDLTASTNFQFGETDAQVFFSVDNMFNKQPPTVGLDANTQLDDPSASRIHDLIGRYYRAGIRIEL